ncbi:Zn(2)-C6 fungal-type domain-containing protein [Mycena sanguinolenta]|uniref:Zn(2)-C6 fungal-type domain-containing protein n=1 Tax=Mycena sanguinolenta TaxID=230812 RepID=A0A8H7CLC6_9AGAR|nr:Zn(2)-C6 fungal-type domain-containing protein [Mycena sanguinolenta]
MSFPDQHRDGSPTLQQPARPAIAEIMRFLSQKEGYSDVRILKMTWQKPYLHSGDSAKMPNGRCTGCISLNALCTHSHQIRVAKVHSGPKNKCSKELQKQLALLEAKLNVAEPSSSEIPSDVSVSPPSQPEENLPCRAGRTGYVLAKNAMAAKEAYLGRPIVSQFDRPEFWFMQPWEVSREQKPQYVYPDPDLIASLVNYYFLYDHPVMPLLHRPSFEKSVAEGLHLSDHRFGATLLAVLALASRYSDDPRVFSSGSDPLPSSGWKFFNQVQVIKKSVIELPSIYDVQLYTLIALYSIGTSSPNAAWLYIGLGLRFIQERGAHRQLRHGKKITAEDELWKRAFWCLLSMERTSSAWLGRPPALHLEEYDIELPLEVDDEYWDHPDPDQAFKQPAGKPSLIAYFICNIRLGEIQGLTLRRLYGSNKSRVLHGFIGDDWEQQIIAELDSSLDEFLNSIPDHLRWDPNRAGAFFEQSTALLIDCYNLRIMIHRPYIRKPTILALSSLNKCTGAARALIHAADVWLHKTQRVIFVHMHTSIFTAAAILLINLYGAKRAGLPIHAAAELAHVEAAMRILKFHETRFQMTGRLWDMLHHLNSWRGSPPSKGKFTDLPFKGTQVQVSAFPGVSPQGPSPGMFSTIEGGLSMRLPQHLHPGATIQNEVPPATSIIPLQRAAIPMQPSFEAANNYDDVTGFSQISSDWSNTLGIPNEIVDQHTQSRWGTAPTTFADLADWDAYIESMNSAANSWSTNYDPQLETLFPLPQQQSSPEGHFFVGG